MTADHWRSALVSFPHPSAGALLRTGDSAASPRAQHGRAAPRLSPGLGSHAAARRPSTGASAQAPGATLDEGGAVGMSPLPVLCWDNTAVYFKDPQGD